MDRQSPHCVWFGGNPMTMAENLCNLKMLLSPHCSLLALLPFSMTYFIMEEFNIAAETKKYEGMGFYQNNIQYIHNFTMVEIHNASHHVDWIHEFSLYESNMFKSSVNLGKWSPIFNLLVAFVIFNFRFILRHTLKSRLTHISSYSILER